MQNRCQHISFPFGGGRPFSPTADPPLFLAGGSIGLQGMGGDPPCLAPHLSRCAGHPPPQGGRKYHSFRKSSVGPLITAIFFFLSQCVFSSGPLNAQEEAAPADEEVVAAALGSTEAANAQAQEQIEMPPDRLYLDFKGATLLNVLTILSELAGINYVAGTEVAERGVNMVLDEVTLDDALVAIARGSNVVYDYLPRQNIYLFRASSDAPELPPLRTRVFKLYYVRASGLREIDPGQGGGGGGGGGGAGGSGSATSFTVLREDEGEAEEEAAILSVVESILSERGRVDVDDRSNSLVVTDTEERLNMVEEAISELDRPLDQVLIRVILIETFEDLDKAIGIEWSNETTRPATSGAFGELGTVTGGRQTSEFPFNINDSLRIFDRRLGFDTSLKDVDAGDTALTATTTSTGDKDFTALAIRLKALQMADKLRIVAKPRILVLDNHPALIKITTREAIGQQAQQAAAEGLATATTNVAERTETGTSLRVTPLINTDSRITMTLEPAFVTTAAAGFSISNTGDPTIRTARTTLMVNDGQTIVLGGLLSSKQQKVVRKLPVLGDLPVIGRVFTAKATLFDDRELILFVNPSIVRDPSEVQAVAIPDQRLRMEDELAPFWKIKRKQWYQELKSTPQPEIRQMEDYIAGRERLMDETLTEMAGESQKLQPRN